jgi:hypothetical protein
VLNTLNSPEAKGHDRLHKLLPYQAQDKLLPQQLGAIVALCEPCEHVRANVEEYSGYSVEQQRDIEKMVGEAVIGVPTEVKIVLEHAAGKAHSLMTEYYNEGTRRVQRYTDEVKERIDRVKSVAQKFQESPVKAFLTGQDSGLELIRALAGWVVALCAWLLGHATLVTWGTVGLGHPVVRRIWHHCEVVGTWANCRLPLCCSGLVPLEPVEPGLSADGLDSRAAGKRAWRW